MALSRVQLSQGGKRPDLLNTSSRHQTVVKPFRSDMLRILSMFVCLHDNWCGVLFSEVFCVCTTHALTTETEEVMGLLLGDVHVSTEVPAPKCTL